MYKLFLDDERWPTRTEGVLIVRSSQEAINATRTFGCPGYVDFDHDLGGDDTSMRYVNWLIGQDLDNFGGFIPKDFTFDVHSQNPEGARNIRAKLDRYLDQR